MTDQRNRERAAGYVYVYDSTKDTQALLFGRCGTSRDEIFYRVTLSDNGGSSRQVALQVQGDFTPWIQHELIDQIGKRPVSLQVQANTQRFSVQFTPAPAIPGNALFRTTTGLQGTVIKTHSSTWEIVALVAIFALASVTIVAMNEDTNLKVEATVDAPTGDASVNIEVNGRPPGEGGEGE